MVGEEDKKLMYFLLPSWLFLGIFDKTLPHAMTIYPTFTPFHSYLHTTKTTSRSKVAIWYSIKGDI